MTVAVRNIDDALVEKVVETSIALEIPDDYWERQGIITTLLRWDHPRGEEVARHWLDHAVATQTSEGLLSHGGTTQLTFGTYKTADSPIMQGFVAGPDCSSYFGHPLLALHERTGDARYLRAAADHVEAIRRGPATSEGYYLMNLSRPEVWVDALYPVCGLFAYLGRLAERPELVDDAYHQLLVGARRLIDPATGLARHVWCERPDTFPESAFWGRGNGFFSCAAAETLEQAPDHRDAPAVREVLAGLLRGAAAHQDRSGFLYDYIDDPGTRAESSGTLMFAYATGLAHELGVADDALVEAAVRALDAVAGIVDPEGGIGRITFVPGGPGVPRGTMVLGRSFFLLAAYHLRDAIGLRPDWTCPT
ncbi:MAG: glycoside hydrolase family 88 protein [Acidimicrobiia bacterium]